MQPRKRYDPALPVASEQLGTDEDCANLIKNDKRQQEKDGVNRPACPLEIGVLREVEQLACAAFVFTFRSVGRNCIS
ncbi:MAG: hypothetical protein PHY02_02765 [Phycisphaerae bacterium]|nr:hypothetical protein [Phycisphaerae bacterium]